MGSIKALSMLALCWGPSRSIALMFRAAELSQGGVGWLQGSSSSEILGLFCLSGAFRWQLTYLVSSCILSSSPLVLPYVLKGLFHTLLDAEVWSLHGDKCNESLEKSGLRIL